MTDESIGIETPQHLAAERVQLGPRVGKCKSLCVVIPEDADALAGEEALMIRSEMRQGFQLRETIDGWRIGLRKAEHE